MLSHLYTPQHSSSVPPFPNSFSKGRGYVEGKPSVKRKSEKKLIAFLPSSVKLYALSWTEGQQV